MRFAAEDRDGVARGEITVAYRRWRTPRARAGVVHRTNAGRLHVDEVAVIAEADIDEADARRAGRPSAEAARAGLWGDPALPLYRIAFHLMTDDDPRAALAADDDLGRAAREEIRLRLARLDRAARDGPWTAATLRAIAERPATRAADLAASLGRETLPFKRDVRKLKELGLTHSLERGYELSPRGRAFLAGEPR
jgi:hypothetical protein